MSGVMRLGIFVLFFSCAQAAWAERPDSGWALNVHTARFPSPVPVCQWVAEDFYGREHSHVEEVEYFSDTQQPEFGCFQISPTNPDYTVSNGSALLYGPGSCPPGFELSESDSNLCEKTCVEGLTCDVEKDSDSCTNSKHPIDFIDGEKYRREEVLSVGSAFPIDLKYHYSSNKGLEYTVGGDVPGQGHQATSTASLANVVVVETSPLLNIAQFYHRYGRSYFPSPAERPDLRVFRDRYWRHNYSHWLELRTWPEVKYVWHQSEGSPLVFERFGDAKANSNVVLDSTDDGYVIELKSEQLRYEFDDKGRLKIVTDVATGSHHTLTYREEEFYNTSHAGYSVDRITHSSGQYIEFNYDLYDTNPSLISQHISTEANFPTKVTDSSGRSVDIVWGNQPTGVTQTFYLITEISDPYEAEAEGRRVYEYNDPHYSTALTHIYDYPETGGDDKKLYAEFEYDRKGRAISSALAGGVDAVTVQYIDNYNTTVTNALGKQTSFLFENIDGIKRLKSVTGEPTAACEQSNYTVSYNNDGLISEKVRDGRVTLYTYDNERGLETSRTEAAGTSASRVISTIWDDAHYLPKTIVEPTKTTHFAYTVEGLLQSESIHADGSVRETIYHYNNEKLLERIDGPRTDVLDHTLFEYDSNGLLTRVTNALGQTMSYGGYDDLGRANTITDYNGVVTELEYDAKGYLISSTIQHPSGDSSLDLTTQYVYNGFGELTEIVSPSGQRTYYEYDDAYRLTAIVNHIGERLELTLDLLGNVTNRSILNSSSEEVFRLTQEFDELSRVRKLIGAENQTTQIEYDVHNNVTEITNGRNHTRSQSYDALDRLVTQLDPLLNQTSYEYADDDQVSQVTDARTLSTEYIYNGFGDLVQLVSPDTGVTTYLYDEAGNRVSEEDARGIVALYEYDALNRLVAINYPNQSEQNVSYVYDDQLNGNFGVGRVTQIIEQAGIKYFSYDYLGNVTEVSYSIESQGFSQPSSYDESGRLIQWTYPSGRQIHYSYDALDRIHSISTQLPGEALHTVVSDITYAPFGGVSGWIYGNGVEHRVAYDLDYRPAHISDTGTETISSVVYAYDANSNITSLLDAVNAPQTFAYSETDRLVSASGSYGDLGYAYDSVGNRLEKTHTQDLNTLTTNYIYEQDSQRLAEVHTSQGSQRDFHYDANGNLVLDTRALTYSWIYDDRNRPASVTVDGETVSYVHNVFGQRVLKSHDQSSAYYHYDQRGQLIATNDESGQFIEEIIWLLDQQVAVVINEPESSAISLDMLSPAIGTQINYGDAIVFNAHAFNGPQNLSDDVAWSSSIDGSLGVGASLSIHTLSVGNHNISATVNGQYVQRSLIVLANEAPIIILGQGQNEWTRRFSGETHTFSASAIDAQDGDLTDSLQWHSDLEGVLGSGLSVSVNLSVGTHVITVSVTDSQGNLVSETFEVQVFSGVDTDNDGLSDLWELLYFSSLDQNQDDDFDGDGLSNEEEYLNGTDPSDENNTILDLNTFDADYTYATLTLSDDAKTMTNTEAAWRSAVAKYPLAEGGKYYWEADVTQDNYGTMIGIGSDVDVASYVGATPQAYGWFNNGVGRLYHDGAHQPFEIYSEDSRVMIAYDAVSGQLWFGKNGEWYGNPETGEGAQFSGIVGEQYPAASSKQESVTLIFDPNAFLHIPPTGFTASVNPLNPPTLHYDFDSPSGSVVLDQMGEHHATIYGADVVDGVLGSALKMDTLGDRVEVPHDDALNASGDYAISMLLKFSGASYGLAFGKFSLTYPWDGPTVFLNYDDDTESAGHITFRDSADPAYVMSSSQNLYNDDQWRHFVFQRKGNQLQLWINGSLDSELTLPDIKSFTDTNPLYLMGRSDLQLVTGDVDETQYWSDRSLSDEEINSLHNEYATELMPSNVTDDIYAQFDPDASHSSITYSEQNTVAYTAETSIWQVAFANLPLSQGKKYYWELSVTKQGQGTGADTGTMVGIGAKEDAPLDKYLGKVASGYSWYSQSSRIYNNGSYSSISTGYGETARIMIAFDPDEGKLWFGRDGIWVDSANPDSGEGAHFENIQGTQFPGVSLRGEHAFMYFDPSEWLFSAPSGFEALSE